MYQSLTELIEENQGKLTLFIPKNNRLGIQALRLINKIRSLGPAVRLNDTTLMFGGLIALLRRGEDIPKRIERLYEKGEFSYGITGEDLFEEYLLRNPKSKLVKRAVYEWNDYDMLFGKPALCLINKTGLLDFEKGEVTAALSPKYEYTSIKFLQKEPLLKNVSLKYDLYCGDLEAAVTEGIADFCVDIVSSGNTIKEKKLIIARVFRYSDLALISPPFS
jgi:ATP phosphoribosyltransferase